MTRGSRWTDSRHQVVAALAATVVPIGWVLVLGVNPAMTIVDGIDVHSYQLDRYAYDLSCLRQNKRQD